MADLTLETFKSRLKDVARPNRFIVTLNNPVGISPEQLSFFVKASKLPGVTTAEIEMKWQGLKTYFAGDPTYEEWSVTVYNDYDGLARQLVEKWYNEIIKVPDNTRGAPADYRQDLLVAQLGRKGETLAQYKIIGAFPTNVATIELSMDSESTVEEFEITFKYDYWIRI